MHTGIGAALQIKRRSGFLIPAKKVLQQKELGSFDILEKT